MIMLGAGYIVFSYYQTLENTKARYQTLFLQEKEEINEVLQNFQSFLDLIEARLLDSSHSNKDVSSILAMKPENYISKKFPEILGITFSHASNPTVVYSRLGKKLFNNEPTIERGKNSVAYLGKGIFKISKQISNKNKVFGFLQSTFSIEPLLYKHFSESEVGIYPAQQKPSHGNHLFSEVAGLSYFLILKQKLPSFWDFLLLNKMQILLTFLFVLLMFFVGVARGLYISHKLLIRQHLTIQRLKEKLKSIKVDQQNVMGELLISQNLWKLKEDSQKKIGFLFTVLLERYQQMARQVQAINVITSRLIAEEAGNDKLLKEIHSISQDSKAILEQLVNGFPVKANEEPLDVLDSIESIKTIFLPEITQRNVYIEIKGKIKNPIYADNVIFEIVLHNIYSMIIDRLTNKNLLKIEIKEGDSLQIIFSDDGYDVGDKVYEVKTSMEPENILCLSKARLREFIQHLGWVITFQREEKFINQIRLIIPHVLQERSLPHNVVNLSDFKPYAS